MPYRRGSFALTPPTWPIFAIALVLTILAALTRYKILAVAALAPHSFEMMFAAAVLLLVGALFRGV